jgi:hypothetical protein
VDKVKPTRANSMLGAAESGPGVIARNGNGIDTNCLAVLTASFPHRSSKGPPWTVLAESQAAGRRARIGLASTLYVHPRQLMAPPI